MRSEAGFTLIDLMITISIIGILSSIALPNYQNFVARSRQTEAKLTLSAIYTAEITFFSENHTYTTCISTAGYVRPTNNIYYSAGFGNASSTCGQTNAEDCHVIDHAAGTVCPQGVFPAGGYFPADKAASGTPVNRATLNSTVTTTITRNSFTAGAAGRISLRGATRVDGWTINENRSIQNNVNGL